MYKNRSCFSKRMLSLDRFLKLAFVPNRFFIGGIEMTIYGRGTDKIPSNSDKPALQWVGVRVTPVTQP